MRELTDESRHDHYADIDEWPCVAPRCEGTVSDAHTLCDSCQDLYWEAAR
jgi:hypothetical protein